MTMTMLQSSIYEVFQYSTDYFNDLSVRLPGEKKKILAYDASVITVHSIITWRLDFPSSRPSMSSESQNFSLEELRQPSVPNSIWPPRLSLVSESFALDCLSLCC